MGLSSKEGLDWAQNMLEISDPSHNQNQVVKQQQQQQICGPLKCPRCSSSNTKFCYYNNYNKSQPRHFCKSCKRHWTQGGTLRSVPVGGARKNKRIKTTTTVTPTNIINNNENKSRSSSSCSTSSSESGSQLGLQNQEQPWLRGGFESFDHQSVQEASFPDYVNYSDLNNEENMKSLVGCAPSLLSLPSLPFITSSSEWLGNTSNPHLISPYTGQFPSSSSSTTTTSDSYNYVSTTNSTVITTTAIDPSTQLPSPSSTTCVDSLNWDYLDTLISTDLKLPWEDFQTQELKI